MRRFLALVVLIVAGCTPAQHTAWLHWYNRHPEAAIEWATTECGDLCTQDWDRDGLVEPEPSAADSSANQESSADTSETDVEPAPSPLGGACSQWAGIALDAGWSADDWPTLSRIMYAESRCSSSAYNPEPHFGGNASGLMQIIWPTWRAECGDGDPFDPWFNLHCALYLRITYGWGQWATY
jgi:hypothetical protein